MSQGQFPGTETKCDAASSSRIYGHYGPCPKRSSAWRATLRCLPFGGCPKPELTTLNAAMVRIPVHAVQSLYPHHRAARHPLVPLGDRLTHGSAVVLADDDRR